TPAPHTHKRTFFGGEKLCPDCQRARVKAQEGIEVPPPPPVPGMVSTGGNCTTCGGHTHMVSTSPVTVMEGAPLMAQGGMMVGGDGAGCAVAGADPPPIGPVQPQLATSIPMPIPRGAAGPRDASVMMSSYAPTPIPPAPSNRPHV